MPERPLLFCTATDPTLDARVRAVCVAGPSRPTRFKGIERVVQ